MITLSNTFYNIDRFNRQHLVEKNINVFFSLFTVRLIIKDTVFNRVSRTSLLDTVLGTCLPRRVNPPHREQTSSNTEYA